MVEQKSACRRRGRPSKLDASTSAQLAAKLLAGASVTQAAREVGVSRRTLTGWLAQAWSRDERDRAQVELVKTLVRGEKAYGAIGRRLTVPSAPIRDAPLRPLDELLHDLDVGD
ncbi:MAG TPA: helix-turn-helix domain-containing protein [Solirubrobacteraceae bacterium]